MTNKSNLQTPPGTKASSSTLELECSYRGFSSIDQEIEREIAMQWFSKKKKSSFSQRNFLLKKKV